MDDPIALLLKFGFLAVLYLFLLWVARSSLRDLSGTQEAGQLPGGPPAAAIDDEGAAAPDLRAGIYPHLEVVAALGHEPGDKLDLADGATLGRSDHAEVNVDDPFASAAHARIFERGSYMYIEDMGSTNGTYLNGRQLRRPEQLKVADTIRIGDTEYRYQE